MATVFTVMLICSYGKIVVPLVALQESAACGMFDVSMFSGRPLRQFHLRQ